MRGKSSFLAFYGKIPHHEGKIPNLEGNPSSLLKNWGCGGGLWQKSARIKKYQGTFCCGWVEN